jgi:hypothetical protein
MKTTTRVYHYAEWVPLYIYLAYYQLGTYHPHNFAYLTIQLNTNHLADGST